jgi:energy-coupling factor transporter ATP-binding protein EcfA2
MKTFAYIFGQPGAGKTTLMRALCGNSPPVYEARDPVRHRCFSRGGKMFAVLGGDAYPFGGTDTLSFTAVGSANRWLASLASCAAGRIVLAEGDRLANDRFFDVARKHYRLLTFYLCCKDDEAASRRAKRASKHGLALQSDSWVKGRVTKHANLAARQEDAITLDAKRPPEELAAIVWASVLQEK